MRRFPKEFSELLSPKGLRLLNGDSRNGSGLFREKNAYFANFSNLIKSDVIDACIRLMDDNLRPHL